MDKPRKPFYNVEGMDYEELIDLCQDKVEAEKAMQILQLKALDGELQTNAEWAELTGLIDKVKLVDQKFDLAIHGLMQRNPSYAEEIDAQYKALRMLGTYLAALELKVDPAFDSMLYGTPVEQYVHIFVESMREIGRMEGKVETLQGVVDDMVKLNNEIVAKRDADIALAKQARPEH